MKRKLTVPLLALAAFIGIAVPAPLQSEQGKDASYEFEPKSPAFEVFLLQRNLEYVSKQIRTANQWIPSLTMENPEIEPKKVLSQLREQQAQLKEKIREFANRAAKENDIFQQPFLQKGTILQRHQSALSDVLLQTVRSRQSTLTEACPSNYFVYSSLAATEFREYKSTTVANGINTGSNWPLRDGTLESPILDADTLRFDAYAFPIPGTPFDYRNSIWTAGLLKFDFPAPPCDVVVEWSAVVNIDFVIGAIISGENDGIMVDLVLREQPESTRFPDVGLDDAGFQWIDWGDLDFYDPDAPNWQRRTKRVRLAGQFNVATGTPSSLIIGPSLLVSGNSEWASIGHENNPWDDGAFFFNGMGEDCFYGTPCGPQDLSIEFLMRPR